jgi:hypothetical protein
VVLEDLPWIDIVLFRAPTATLPVRVIIFRRVPEAEVAVFCVVPSGNLNTPFVASVTLPAVTFPERVRLLIVALEIPDAN